MMGSNSVSNNAFFFFFFFSVFLLSLLFRISSAQLSSNYYASTCPTALSVTRNVVVNAVVKEHRMGASLLRLHFHDCFVNACSLSLSLPSNVCMHLQAIIFKNFSYFRMLSLPHSVSCICSSLVD